ncbi:MAG TPA: PKD domain-containing protein [Candidatus Paceibacterota bacterium]
MTMRAVSFSLFALLIVAVFAPWHTKATTPAPVAIYATPVSGVAPLVVTFTANNSAACSAGSYKLEYGDGKFDTIFVPAYACQSAFTIQHTYLVNGTYDVVLSTGGTTVDIEIITVGGGSTASSKLIQDFIFSAATASDETSLAATFRLHFVGDAMCDGGAYSIDYGDGATATIPSSAYTNHCYQTSLTTLKEVTGSFASHTYASANTYEAKLKRNDQVLETLSLKVGSAVETGVSATPTSGQSPISVNFTVKVKCSDLSASGDMLRLSFGDGGTEAIVGNLCNGSATLQHTYTLPGTYTATLIDRTDAGANNVLDSVTVTVRPKDSEDEDTSGLATCPALTKQLQKGDTDASTNGEVSLLQQFLTDYFLLDGSLVVGTFGPLTESYVKQFQTFVGLSPVGWVGPQTRAAILAACEPIYSLVATPSSGSAPLQVDFAYSDPAQAQVYNIDFGDGTTGKLVYTVGTDCGTNCLPRYDAFHTYSLNGTYTAKLTHVVDPCVGKTGCTDPLEVTEVASATVMVGVSAGGSGSTCVALTYNLYADTTDATTNGEVTKLQNFLIAGGYMEGSATGFFGPITEKGVQKYQAGKGIVSSGSPDTTGYGFVGPQTRAAMTVGCEVSGTAGTAALTVNLKSGAAPHTVLFGSNIGGTIDFGDGTSAEMPLAPTGWAISHTYTSPAIYTASLLKQGGTACQPITYDPNNPLSFLDLLTGNTCAKVGIGGSTIVATVAVKVTAGTQTPVLTTNTSTVPSGGSATISWTAPSGSSCEFSSPTNSPAVVAYGTVSATGSSVVGPLTQDAVFVITCGDQSVGVSIFIVRTAPVITAYPMTVPSGGRATVSWSAPAGSTCIYSSPTNSPTSFPYGVWGNTGGTGVGPLTQDATYTITCGGQSSSVTVDVTN